MRRSVTVQGSLNKDPKLYSNVLTTQGLKTGRAEPQHYRAERKISL